MPQVTIYLPDDLLDDIKSEAKKAGKSVSAYMGELARRSVRPRHWPSGFFKLAGSCPGLTVPEDAPPEAIEGL